MGNAKHDLAQLTDRHSQLGRVVRETRITIPSSLELSSDRSYLVWPQSPPEVKVRVLHTEAGAKMLDDFIKLWKMKPEGTLRFARKWGVLYLDRDGRPCYPNGPFRRIESLDTL